MSDTRRQLTYPQAVNEACDQEMQRDASVFLFGLGVDDYKGILGTTTGLLDKHGPDRVFDTPLSEDAMTGVAIGAALAGLRPIHVHIRMDFLMLAMNQLVNMAAKMRYASGGALSVPLVVRSIIGKSWGQGAQHSQGLHSFFTHVPGLKVVAPTVPYDVKGIMTAAIRDNDPVMFIEHRMLYFQKGFVPEESYTVPIGQARVLQSGSDVTLVGILFMAVECMRAQRYLRETGIDAEVIDPVSLSPLDIDTIVTSVKKTGRLIVADTGWTSCGVTAEIVAGVTERLQGVRTFSVQRLGFAPVTCPTTRPLEDLFYPNAAKIASAAYALVSQNGKAWSPKPTATPELVEFKGPF